jgi:hypothetical protein
MSEQSPDDIIPLFAREILAYELNTHKILEIELNKLS